MSQLTQAIAIIGTASAVYALACIIQLGIHVWTGNDHNESHDWSDE